MDPVVVENIKKRLQNKVKQFHKELQDELPEVRAAFDALQQLIPQDIERVYRYTQRFQTLIKEQERLKPHQIEPINQTFEGGAVFGWIEFWIEDCQLSPSRNLSRIPYKQCKECGQALTQKRSKSFCPSDCAESYRKWRDNVRDVANNKDYATKQIYIREKALTKYREQERPQLVTVSEKAWQLACQIMQEHYGFIPAENVLQYNGQKFKIVQWLLNHYVQRRTLEALIIPDLTVKVEEIEPYQNPGILYKFEI